MTAMISTSFALNLFLPNVHAEEAIAEVKGPVVQDKGPIVEMKDARVTINGQDINFDVPPAMKSGRTLVPLRAIFEAMGAAVAWDGATQTISAVKDDKSINLTVNSTIAKNGDEELQLDVPATMYKDRTLVPLRFVGEAFGGEVTWDGATRSVSITMDGNPIVQHPATVYLNDKLLDFGGFAPVLKNKTAFIPIESVLDNLTNNEIYWERNGRNIYVEFDGKVMNFYVGENSVIIDNVRVEMGKPIIEENGQVLVPTDSFAKILGGYSYYKEATNETLIYINRAKFLHDFLAKEKSTFAQPTNVVDTKYVGTRRIMVSDNPENLNTRTVPGDNETLWQDEVKTAEASMDHRVFGWHINEFDQNVSVGITIENLSKTNDIEVVGLKGTSRQTPNTWVNYDVGLPLAEKSLSGKVTTVKMTSPVVKSGENALMKSFELKQSNTIGFQYDFTVKRKSGTGELNYKIRTVISKNGEDLTAILNNPVPIDEKARHPRGVWSSSQLQTELTPYKVGDEETAYQISNGVTDNLMTPESGLGDSTQMIRNPGHYGASYTVKIPIVNETGEPKTVRIRIGARGGIYNGAVKVDGKVYLTPTLMPLTEVANLIDYVAKEKNGMIELEIMHAGGSALPMVIDLLTVEEQQQEPELPDSQDLGEQQDPEGVQDSENGQTTEGVQTSEDSLDTQQVQGNVQ